jgi:hypothetical protein
MIREALREAIDRMESVASIGSRHDPLVVRLVKTLVDPGMMQATMDPVDAEVGEEQEEWELHDVVPAARSFGREIVQLAAAAQFVQEDQGRHKRKQGHRLAGILDLEENLVLEILGMIHGVLVEDEEV